MNLENVKADMELVNLYFEKIKFSRKETIVNGEYKVEVKRTFEQKDDLYIITMPFEIKKSDFSLSLVAVGKFRFNSNIEEMELRENMIKNNGAAIIFPFIRSQVAQVTAQPGMTPIVIPAINVTKIIDED